MAGITVVVNPTKFSNIRSARRSLDVEFAKFGVTQYNWVETTAEDTGTGQTRTAVKSGAEMVMSWGGDGTVRSVAMGLLGTEVPLGILPGGTGNLIAKNLKLPLTLSGAVGVAMGGGVKKIDANEVDLGDGIYRISLLMCGMGLDAAVIDSPEELKQKFGPGAYAYTAAKNLKGEAKPLTVVVDEELPRRVQARMALVGNFGRMQMGINLFDKVNATDGKLAVSVAKLRGIREIIWTGLGVFLGTKSRGKHRIFLTGKTVTFRTTEPWPREIDGDLVQPGDYMAVKVLPAAILVRVR